MLRVLHCIYDDPQNPWVGGGGAVRVFEIYRRLAPRLQSITVATGRFPGCRDEVIEGVQYRRLGAAKPYVWSRLSYARAATKLLEQADYDAAVFDFSTYTPLRIPAGRPVGITVHHLSAETASERWGRAAGALLHRNEVRRLRQARMFSATSLVMQEQLRRLVPNAQIRLIQAGVPDELFTLPHEESGYILCFGRLDWFHKGLDVLLDALVSVRTQHPSVQLKIAGRGRDAERVRQGIVERGVEANVELVGAVSDAARNELLRGALLMVMPSRFEGFGLAAAEAMAAGVPLVASDAGSLPEVVAAPRGGVNVPAGDAAALAAAITQLLDDAARRKALSGSARLSAERFRWQHIADQHLEFLTAIHESNR